MTLNFSRKNILQGRADQKNIQILYGWENTKKIPAAKIQMVQFFRNFMVS